MPCDTVRAPKQTEAERRREVQKAIKSLERALLEKVAGVVIGPQGAVAFKGWQDRAGVSDTCAYRLLSATGSTALRLEVEKAERLAGRSADRKAIAAGYHSHDGGKTWGTDKK